MKTAWLLILALSLLTVVTVARSAPSTLESRVARASQNVATNREPAVDSAELAHALVAVEKNEDRLAMLLAIGVHESALRASIARGECGPHECDRDSKTHAIQAWGLWQQWKNYLNRADWGNPSLGVQAKWAARQLRGAYARCRDYPGMGGPNLSRAAIRAYAGRGCDQPIRGEDARLATYLKVRRQL